MPLLLAQATGLQGISDGAGLAITITGMLIVFIALAGITLFISALPKVLEWVEPWFPENQHHHAPAPPQSVASSDDEVVAAIGFVLHHQSSRRGDA